MNEAVTDKRSVLYEVGRILGMVVFHTVMPIRFHHRERLNQQEQMILIANHVHVLDPVIMALGVKRKQMVFLGKKELGNNPLARRLLTNLHCILVERGGRDMEAMRACMKAVKTGKSLVIFPEGTRHHEGQMEHIENGTSLIALRSGVPIVPIYIDRPVKCFRLTNLYVGEAIPCDDLLAKGINSDTCDEMNERMREAFRRMIRDTQKKE